MGTALLVVTYIPAGWDTGFRLLLGIQPSP